MVSKVIDKSVLHVLIVGFLLTSCIFIMDVKRPGLTIRYIAWCSTAIALAVMLLFCEKDYSIIKNRIFVVFGIYLLISVFSLLRAINFGEWFFDILRITLMLVSLVLFCFCVKDIGDLSKPFIVLTIILGIYGLWELAHGVRYEISIMGNRNLWSQYLILLSPFCLAAKGKWRILGIFAFILIVCNVFMAVSRAAIVALFVSSVVTTVIFNRKVLCGILVITAIVGIVICFSNSAFVYRLTNSSSAHSRFAIWTQTLKMTWDEFMVGAGNWRIAILPYGSGFLEPQINDEGKRVYAGEAHNSYLEVLSEKSIFGLVAYLCIFIYGLYYCIKSKNPYVFMGLLAYMVYVFFDDKQRAPLMMMLIIFLALAVKSYHRTIPIPKVCKLILPVSLVVLGAVLYGYIVRYEMERRFWKVKNICWTEDSWLHPDEVIDKFSTIPKIITLEAHTTPYLWYRGDAYRAKGMRAEAGKDFLKAYEQNPNNMYVLLSLAESLFYAGLEKESLFLYEKVLKIIPGEPKATMNIKLIKSVL